MAYVVTAPAVAVSVPAGPRVSHVKFVEQGSLLPEGVDEAAITHLLSVGMIAEVQPAESAETPASEPPADVNTADDAEQAAPAHEVNVEDLDLAGLRAYAAEHGIELGGATRKVDILAVLNAAR